MVQTDRPQRVLPNIIGCFPKTPVSDSGHKTTEKPANKRKAQENHKIRLGRRTDADGVKASVSVTEKDRRDTLGTGIGRNRAWNKGEAY